jgi:IclR family pca regulon transcriptional regulator
VARVKLIPQTERTLSSRLRLREVLRTVRKDDYAVADRTTRLPIRSIAVPVRSAAGEVLAGIDIIVRAGRVSRQEMKSLYLPHLRAAARDIGALLTPS